MFSKIKLNKLIKNPNRFFFDYFAKRIGGSTSKFDNASVQSLHQSTEYLMPPGYQFDKKKHPWVQIAEKFDLKTGATTGHPDQSFLIDCRDLIDFFTFTLWIAHGFKSDIRIYTLGGGFEATICSIELLNPKKAEWLYSKIHKKPDFVVEFLGEFDNNFAAHLFIYDVDATDLKVVRSNLAFVKKSMPDTFEKIYPSIINKFGNYEFGTPWPVDVVYTWVTKDDLTWIAMWNETFPDQLFDPDRYSSRDELRYSLRAISKFLPWFHRVHIVTNCARPDWLKDHPKLNWVTHDTIFPDVSVLPTFNSHAIEACLHRIPGLSENFIYFNDDMFVNRPCYYGDFFDAQGRSIANLEPYGMVYEENLFDASREYLSPSINSQKLISQKNPDYKATRLHRHTPYALKKKIIEEIESRFEDDVARTRAARLRSLGDINLPSFMYHHYALVSGSAVCGDFPSLIVRPSNIKSVFDPGSRVYKFLCFNDGDGSAENDRFSNGFKEFVAKAHSFRSCFEIDRVGFEVPALSVAIMAYKDRVDRIPYLRRMIGDAVVFVDDGSLGVWGNAKRCWLSHGNKASFHMVIQDDAIVCKDFYEKIFAIIEKNGPDIFYSLYYRLIDYRRNPDAKFNRDALVGSKIGGFLTDDLRFAPCLIAPANLIPELINYSSRLTGDKFKDADDIRFREYLRAKGKKVFYPLPSLIQHDPGMLSVIGNRSNKSRDVTWYCEGHNGFNEFKKYVERFEKIKTSLEVSIPLFWWDRMPNFGDEIGPYLVEKLSQRKVVNIKGFKSFNGLMCVGSILQQIDRPGMTVWGSGVIQPYGQEVSRKLAAFKPKQITALRGRLTYDYVTRKLGWEANTVFGDPALLMPMFFDPGSGSEGVVVCPHYQHYENLKSYSQHYRVIDVRAGVEPVVGTIALSKACISTSLHGLIVAQAYGVPWVWLRVADSPLRGEDFKFEDFFSVLERTEVSVFQVNLDQLSSLDIDSIAAKARVPRAKYDLSALLDAFPKELRPL